MFALISETSQLKLHSINQLMKMEISVISVGQADETPMAQLFIKNSRNYCPDDSGK